LTTFSTFSWETLQLMEQGLMQKVFLNVLLNVVVCISAAWTGAQWAKSIV
jgi:CrcB protein